MEELGAIRFTGSWVLGPVKTEICMIQSTFDGKLKIIIAYK